MDRPSGRGLHVERPGKQADDGLQTTHYRLRQLATVYIFLVGFLSIVAQVILLRELSAAFYGVDLIYLLALGAWLFWTAIGAVLGRSRGAERRSPNATRVGVLLVAAGLTVPLGVVLVRRLRLLLGGVPGAYLPLPVQIGASAFCLLPASVLLGLLFQWTVKRYLAASNPAEAGSHGADRRRRSGSETRRAAVSADTLHPDAGPIDLDDGTDIRPTGRSLARAYAIESAGAVAGGLATTWALHARVSTFALALVAAAVTFAAALFARERRAMSSGTGPQPRHSPARRVVPAFALGGLLASAIAGWNAAALDRWMTSWNHPDGVDVIDSPYGRVTIAERAGQVTVYENDVLVLDSEGTAPEELAHLSLLQHAAPRRVLLLGGAGAGLLSAVEQHAVPVIDDVELDARVIEGLARHLGADFRTALSSPRVHLSFDDPRRAIATTAATYDVIVVAAARVR